MNSLPNNEILLGKIGSRNLNIHKEKLNINPLKKLGESQIFT